MTRKKHPDDLLKVGRPSKYTPELAERICHLVATNPYGLPTICKQFPDLPSAETIRVWRWEKPEFSAKYAEAKRFQSEIMAESIEDIIDETIEFISYDEAGNRHLDAGILGIARLRVDSRKWTASKLAPKIYGDKVLQEPSNPRETLDKIQALVADLNKTNVSDI